MKTESLKYKETWPTNCHTQYTQNIKTTRQQTSLLFFLLFFFHPKNNFTQHINVTANQIRKQRGKKNPVIYML